MTRDERDGERETERDEELQRLLARWSASSLPEGMDDRMLAAYRRQTGGGQPLWKRLLTASVRVPLPVAVGVLLLLIVTAALARRRRRPLPPRGRPRLRSRSRPSATPRPRWSRRRASPAFPAGDRGDGHRRHRRDGRRADDHDGDARMTATVTAVVLAAALAPASGAGERFAFARLQNGASIGFALLRSGGPGDSVAIGEAALPRSNSVSRVLWDRTSGAYFGYRVEVERRGWAQAFPGVVQGARPRSCGSASSSSAVTARTAPAGRCSASAPIFRNRSRSAKATHSRWSCSRTETRVSASSMWSSSPRAPATAEAMHAASARASEGQEAVRRAEILGARGLYAEAAEEYRKALAVQPLDAGVHNKLGICHQYLQDEAMAQARVRARPRAQALLRRGVEQPGHAGAVQPTLQAGGARLQEGDRDQAHARDVLEERRSRLCGARAGPGRIRGRPVKPSASTRRCSRARRSTFPPPESTSPCRTTTSPSSSP